MRTLVNIGLAAFLLLPFTAGAENDSSYVEKEIIYKWKSADGVLHYSNVKKQGVKAEIIVVQTRSAAPQDQPAPPIAQDLVRQGYLALKLLEKLGVGSAENESEAESMLALAGIAPEGGWIADYPVTPDVVVELGAAITRAADTGEIGMKKAEALGAFNELLAGFGLPPDTDSENEPGRIAGESDPEGYVEPRLIEEHYAEAGPPVITYYPPPPDYGYLYGWVSYPFWWYGHPFYGYYILKDFHIVVGHKHHRHGRLSRHGHHGKKHVIHHDHKRLHKHGFGRRHERKVISSHFAKSGFGKFKKVVQSGKHRNIHRRAASEWPHERGAFRPHNPGNGSLVRPDSGRHRLRFKVKQVERPHRRWGKSSTMTRGPEHHQQRHMLRGSGRHQGASTSVRIIGPERGHRDFRGNSRMSKPHSGKWGESGSIKGNLPSKHGKAFKRRSGGRKSLSAGQSGSPGHGKFSRGSGRGGGSRSMPVGRSRTR